MGSAYVAEGTAVTRAVLGITRDGVDERALAEQICRACVVGLHVDGAAISLLTASSTRERLYATDTTAELLEDLQFSLGEGACVEAAMTGRAVLVPDLSRAGEGTRWPVFAGELVERTEVGALFAVPLQWGTINVGVLELYRRAVGSLSETQLRDVMSAVDIATPMFLGLRTDPGDQTWLDHSAHGGGEIHQATGMGTGPAGRQRDRRSCSNAGLCFRRTALA